VRNKSKLNDVVWANMKYMMIAVALNTLASGMALAEEKCSEPLTDWKPRQAMRAKLERDGWRIVSIKPADGCYKVIATDEKGALVDAYFDPKNFNKVETVVQN
jgi:hypothetical protein